MPEQPQIVGTSYGDKGGVAPRPNVGEAGIGIPESSALPTQDIQAVAPRILPMGAGLEEVGAVVGEYGAQQAKAQQTTWLMNASSGYDLQARNMLETAKRNAQPGENIGPAVKMGLTKLRTDSMTGIDNPILSEQYNNRMMQTQEEVMAHAAEYDFNERDRFTKFNVVNGYNNMAKNIGASTNYDDAGNMATKYLGELGHTLDQTPMLPQDKQDLILKGRELIGEAANRQQININRDRWIAEHASAFPTEMHGMLDLPRGIRNNNPGNLESGDFQGAKGKDGNYLKFDTPENGLRAMMLNLKNQQDLHGLNTVQDIIGKYAPPEDNNDTNAYIMDVSHRLNVQPDQKLDMHDPEILAKFGDAIVRHENKGAMPYAPETVDWSVKSALGHTTDAAPVTTTADGGARTGNLAFNMMTYPEQQKLVTYAYTEMRRVRSEAAFYGNLANADMAAIEKAAEEGTPIPASLLQSATDKIQAAPSPAAIGRLNLIKDKIETSTAMWRMTPDQAQEYVSGLEKQATAEGATPQMLANYTFSQKIFGNMLASIRKDPLGTYEKTGGDVKPLDFNDPGSIAARASVANTVSKTYNVPAATAFFRQEDRAAITNILNSATPKQALGLLSVLSKNMDEPLYQGVMAQLRPNSPVTALAGGYMGLGRSMTIPGGWFGSDTTLKPEDVANKLLIGDSILNPSKADKLEEGRGRNFPLPKEEDFRRSMPSEYNGIFRGLPRQEADMMQAVKSYYAAEAAQKGDYSGNLNPEILKTAYHAVLGNAANINGRGKVLAPWGMANSDFNDVMDRAYNAQAKIAGIDVEKFPFRSVGFENRGVMGQYRVVSGSGYLVNKKGEPVIINIGATK